MKFIKEYTLSDLDICDRLIDLYKDADKIDLTYAGRVGGGSVMPEQLKLMSLSGNANAATFFRNHGVRDLHIKTEQKYNSGAARQYRAQLKKMLASESTMLPDYGDTDTPMSPSSSETDLESILQGFDEGRPAQPPLNKTGQFSLLSLT